MMGRGRALSSVSTESAPPCLFNVGRDICVLAPGHRPLVQYSADAVTMTSTSLGLTRVLAVLGMVASSLALAPVLYTHLTHRDHSTLLPWLTELQVNTNFLSRGNKDRQSSSTLIRYQAK